MSRLQVTWLLLGGFLITAIGGSAAVLLFQPERTDGGLNEWVILTVLVLAAAAALGVLHGRWFSRVPDDPATGTSVGIILRLAVIELVWLVTFVFFMFWAVGAVALFASVISGIVLALLFAAPTGRLIEHLQEQLNAQGALIDLDHELKRPLT